MNKTEKFTEKILSNSQSNDWLEAKGEWRLEYPYLTDEGICVCGQKHIREMCCIYNPITKVYLNIGHCCYKSLLGRASLDGLFKMLRYEKSLTERGIYYIPSFYEILKNYDKYNINEWECGFLINIRTYDGREYTEKQLNVLKRILPFIRKYPDECNIHSLKIVWDSGCPTITGMGKEYNYMGGRPFFNVQEIEKLPKNLYNYKLCLKRRLFGTIYKSTY